MLGIAEFIDARMCKIDENEFNVYQKPLNPMYSFSEFEGLTYGAMPSLAIEGWSTIEANMFSEEGNNRRF